MQGKEERIFTAVSEKMNICGEKAKTEAAFPIHQQS